MSKKILVSGMIMLSLLTLRAQHYYMTSPEGFGEGTTGGGDATPVTVTNYSGLVSNLTAATPRVILVSGTIEIPAGSNISEVITDKTLLGLPGARLVNYSQTQSGSGILNLKNGSNNVIIRNLIFEGAGAYDTDGRDNLTADGCSDLWVDHCEFQDGVDGNFDNKGKTDNVTISWCKFTYLKPPTPGGSGGADDHRFTNLVGSSSSDAPADGHYSITFQNCYWADGCRERMPRARNGELHVVNCYYNTNVSSSVALGLGGGSNNLTCYVEKSDFAKIGTVYKNYSSDGGTVSLTFDDCLNSVSDVGVVSKPTYSYSVFPVTHVAAFVPNESCGAGATLQVTAEGVISTPCDGSTMFTLTSLTSGNGEGTVELDPAGGTYDIGTIVSINAVPGESSLFTEWSGDTSGTVNPVRVTMNEDVSVTAIFEHVNSITDKTVANIKCYPTVTADKLFIDFTGAGSGTANIHIISLGGQLIRSISTYIYADDRMELDISNMPEGIYFCTIQLNETVLSKKLVKR